MRNGGSRKPKKSWYIGRRRTRLERPLDADERDHGVVAQPVVVQRDQPVREEHDLPPYHDAEAERKVEVVLAVEVEPEERALLGHPAHPADQVEELRVVLVGDVRELGAAEKRDGDAQA